MLLQSEPTSAPPSDLETLRVALPADAAHQTLLRATGLMGASLEGCEGFVEVCKPVQMAAALALGAAGAVVGTRFAVTRESMLSEAKKQRYVAAKAADTQRVRIYDDLGALDWPVGIDGRIIGNAFTLAHGSATLTEARIILTHCL